MMPDYIIAFSVLSLQILQTDLIRVEFHGSVGFKASTKKHREEAVKSTILVGLLVVVICSRLYIDWLGKLSYQIT